MSILWSLVTVWRNRHQKTSKVSKAWILGVADEVRLPMKGLPSDRRLGLSPQENAREFRFDPVPMLSVVG